MHTLETRHFPYSNDFSQLSFKEIPAAVLERVFSS
jgi:hypothetical protein